jgi:hypothetical protein
MKTTLFLATYFNNPHFIELQHKSFQKFVQDDYDFAVIDDSKPDTVAILSGRPSSAEIAEECAKYNVRHIPIPQTVHALEEHGGLVKNDAPGMINLDHPTERHQAVLRWILNNYNALGKDYKYLVIMDADMFFRKPIKMSEYMEGIDIMGATRDQLIDIPSLDEDRRSRVSQDLMALDGQRIKFFTMCLLFINMHTVGNLDTMDNRSYRIVTDTGGRTKVFIENNPQYKYFFMKDWNTAEYRIDFFSKEGPRAPDGTENSPEIIHYNGGSNWDYQSRDYYLVKLNRMFKRWAPELYQSTVEINYSVTSRSGHHTFHKE